MTWVLIWFVWWSKPEAQLIPCPHQRQCWRCQRVFPKSWAPDQRGWPIILVEKPLPCHVTCRQCTIEPHAQHLKSTDLHHTVKFLTHQKVNQMSFVKGFDTNQQDGHSSGIASWVRHCHLIRKLSENWMRIWSSTSSKVRQFWEIPWQAQALFGRLCWISDAMREGPVALSCGGLVWCNLHKDQWYRPILVFICSRIFSPDQPVSKPAEKNSSTVARQHRCCRKKPIGLHVKAKLVP